MSVVKQVSGPVTSSTGVFDKSMTQPHDRWSEYSVVGYLHFCDWLPALGRRAGIDSPGLAYSRLLFLFRLSITTVHLASSWSAFTWSWLSPQDQIHAGLANSPSCRWIDCSAGALNVTFLCALRRRTCRVDMVKGTDVLCVPQDRHGLIELGITSEGFEDIRRLDASFR